MPKPAKNICLYLHVHQPFRLRKLNYLDLGEHDDYFGKSRGINKEILLKVAKKSYLPTNKILLSLLERHPEFCLSLSITGTVIEQFELYAPEVIESFRELVATGRVEILSETYYHSLAALYSVSEFCEQIEMHRNLIKSVFGVDTTSFRNTELIYNDKIATVVREMGFKSIITEGWDPILGWKSSNHTYKAKLEKLTKKEIQEISNFKISARKPKEIKLLLKNYKLSDDLAFRFSNKGWEEYPLSTGKYVDWIKNTPGKIINLFMDYETFGEHQWEDTGIFEFLNKIPGELIKNGIGFQTIAEASKSEAKDEISIPNLISWADMERDLSAWNGNKMQQSALAKIYEVEEILRRKLSQNKFKQYQKPLLEQWRRLQTSDHFYYMSTKYWGDGDVHKYFSPYESPYEAFINYMNVIEDFEQRLEFILK